MKRVLSNIILNTMAAMFIPVLIYSQAMDKTVMVVKAWKQKRSFL